MQVNLYLSEYGEILKIGTRKPIIVSIVTTVRLSETGGRKIRHLNRRWADIANRLVPPTIRMRLAHLHNRRYLHLETKKRQSFRREE